MRTLSIVPREKGVKNEVEHGSLTPIAEDALNGPMPSPEVAAERPSGLVTRDIVQLRAD